MDIKHQRFRITEANKIDLNNLASWLDLFLNKGKEVSYNDVKKEVSQKTQTKQNYHNDYTFDGYMNGLRIIGGTWRELEEKREAKFQWDLKI